jgi:hypothetical protein
VSSGGAIDGVHLSGDASRIATRDLAPDVRIRVWSTDTSNRRLADWCAGLPTGRVRDQATGTVRLLTPGASPDTLEYPLTVSAGIQFERLDSGPHEILTRTDNHSVHTTDDGPVPWSRR